MEAAHLQASAVQRSGFTLVKSGCGAPVSRLSLPSIQSCSDDLDPVAAMTTTQQQQLPAGWTLQSPHLMPINGQGPIEATAFDAGFSCLTVIASCVIAASVHNTKNHLLPLTTVRCLPMPHLAGLNSHLVGGVRI